MEDMQTEMMDFVELAKKRYSVRSFADIPVEQEKIDRVLEAGNIAPTAMNRQEVDLYVCRADGAYLWNAESNVLKRVSDKDLRGFTGRMGNPENFALVAPAVLVYVVDFERQGMQQRPQDAFKYACVDCGFIGQNVYLHAASAGLRTVFLGMINQQELSAGLGLAGKREPIFAQAVGHAK